MDESGAWLVTPGREKTIGKKEIARAAELLARYKDGKRALEQRIVEEEQWWKLRHWEYLRSKKEKEAYEPTSAWLFNSITNKHADAMDNFPEPNVLPREQGDVEDAKSLSEILPVVLERNDYEATYSENWWYKLKHGVAAYGVFWNPTLENGLGDVEIKQIDLLNIFWEPGITDIQKSRNLFIVKLVDDEVIREQYPQAAESERYKGDAITVSDYLYDDTVDTQGKSLVVDWYYKVQAADGRTVLHYCKFVGQAVLFSSENERDEDGTYRYQESGWYAHGRYPVDLDVLYPEQGTPVGFGIIAIAKDPQMYIDKLSGAILESAMWQAKNRHWMRRDCGVNREQFLNLREPIVEVEGKIDEENLRPIAVNQISGNLLSILQLKIDELKETSANRDVSQGSGGGVTAASAIAALQEAGNKGSRDMIGGSYRSYTRQVYLCVELIRQFYDEMREFRILGGADGFQFVQYSNERIKDAQIGQSAVDGLPVYRRPVFDIKVRPQKRSAYSKIQQNELAKELYALGVFNPENAQQVLPMIEMMQFDGKDQVLEKVQEGQMLLNVVMQMRAQMDQMAAMLQGQTGVEMGAAQPEQSGQPDQQRAAVREAPQSIPYGERLAARARTSVDQGGEGTVLR